MVTLIGMLLLLFFSSCLYSSEFKYISSNKKTDVENINKKRQSFINTKSYVSSKILKKKNSNNIVQAMVIGIVLKLYS